MLALNNKKRKKVKEKAAAESEIRKNERPPLDIFTLFLKWFEQREVTLKLLRSSRFLAHICPPCLSPSRDKTTSQEGRERKSTYTKQKG